LSDEGGNRQSISAHRWNSLEPAREEGGAHSSEGIEHEVGRAEVKATKEVPYELRCKGLLVPEQPKDRHLLVADVGDKPGKMRLMAEPIGVSALQSVALRRLAAVAGCWN
jgi:hypothetical protein